MSALSSFTDELKSIGNVKISEAIGGAISFKLEDVDDIESEISNAYANEFFERFYESVDVENPAKVSFAEFRESMTKLSDKIYKKVITPGIGPDVNLEGLDVIYDYSLFLEFAEAPFDSSILNKQPGKVSVKNGMEPQPGCYLALASMKKGEKSQFVISSDYMFGKLGCPPRIPPNADILMEAKILSVVDMSITEPSGNPASAFNLEFKKIMKEQKRAREFYNDGNFMQAIMTYEKIVKKMEQIHLADADEETKQRGMLMKSYLNLAICYNKLKKPEKACVAVQELEKLAPIYNNSKALYAKGIAKMMLNNYDLARRYLEKVFLLTPYDTKIVKALETLSRLESEKAEHMANMVALQMKVKKDDVELKFSGVDAAKSRGHEQEHFELQKFQEDFEAMVIDFKTNSEGNWKFLDIDFKGAKRLQMAHKICEQHQVNLGSVDRNGKQVLSE